MTVNLEDWLHKKIKIAAAEQDMTINDLTIKAVTMYLHDLQKNCKNT
tara:strand:+ start:1424 stop:1564 length:141 start_codon:yes stop_codon:yes gene_type:complete